jgi:hypothetical protein
MSKREEEMHDQNLVYLGFLVTSKLNIKQTIELPKEAP